MLKAVPIWVGLFVATVGPIAVAATSPLLEWRGTVYIAAGFAGIVAFALILLQPLLASGALPGLSIRSGRRVHQGVGVALVVLVVAHVAGLWITSPPDVIDALTFTSATPFSAWGVVAMWSSFAAAALAALRHRMVPRRWRLGHTVLVSLVAVTTVIHALLIDGTMGSASKWLLSALVLAALTFTLNKLRAWRLLRPRPASHLPKS